MTTTSKRGGTETVSKSGCSDIAVFNDRTPESLKQGRPGGFGSLVQSAAEHGPAWSCDSCGYYEPISS